MSKSARGRRSFKRLTRCYIPTGTWIELLRHVDCNISIGLVVCLLSFKWVIGICALLPVKETRSVRVL